MRRFPRAVDAAFCEDKGGERRFACALCSAARGVQPHQGAHVARVGERKPREIWLAVFIERFARAHCNRHRKTLAHEARCRTEVRAALAVCCNRLEHCSVGGKKFRAAARCGFACSEVGRKDVDAAVGRALHNEGCIGCEHLLHGGSDDALLALFILAKPFERHLEEPGAHAAKRRFEVNRRKAGGSGRCRCGDGAELDRARSRFDEVVGRGVRENAVAR